MVNGIREDSSSRVVPLSNSVSKSSELVSVTGNPPSKRVNDITFKEIKGAKFHHGARFKKGSPRWIVVHYTAMAGVSAEKCTKSYARTASSVSTHFFCDSKGVYRVVDEQYVAWHVSNGKVVQPSPKKTMTDSEIADYGDRPDWRYGLAAENHVRWKQEGMDFKGNSDSFGVDICCIKASTKTLRVVDQDWDFNPLAVVNAAKTVAYLCTKYGIDLDHVIRHGDATGKACPRPFVSLSGDKDPHLNDQRWLSFKQMVAEYL